MPGSWKRRAGEPESGGRKTELREEGGQALGSRREDPVPWVPKAAARDPGKNQLLAETGPPGLAAWL